MSIEDFWKDYMSISLPGIYSNLAETVSEVVFRLKTLCKAYLRFVVPFYEMRVDQDRLKIKICFLHTTGCDVLKLYWRYGSFSFKLL